MNGETCRVKVMNEGEIATFISAPIVNLRRRGQSPSIAGWLPQKGHWW
jgi:hypothetical protein